MLHPVDTAHLSVLVAARPRVQREHMSCHRPCATVATAHPHIQGAYLVLWQRLIGQRGSSPPTGSSHFLARVDTRH